MRPHAAADVCYSTLAPAAIIQHLVAEYGLREPLQCEFLARGLNDTYRVRARDASYAFRVYRAGWRTESEIKFEIDYLLHLERARIPVSVPVQKLDGGYHSPFDQPEGRRHAVLFNYAEGKQQVEHDEAQARMFGLASARVHTASDDFTSANQRFQIDIAHLIDKPLAALLPTIENRPDDHSYIVELAAKTRRRLAAVVPELNFGLCHGDLHGANAAFDKANNVVMFDFDCGGAGWRSYDIAVYRWSAELRNKAKNWEPFLEGYRSARSLCSADLEAVPLFVAARCIWILGLHSEVAYYLGKNWMNDDYYNYWFKFMRDWEAKELKSQ